MSEQFVPFSQQKRRIFLWISAPLLIFLFVFSRSAWVGNSFALDIAEMLGIFLIFGAIFGRCWAVLFIGDKKNKQLVTHGPYRYTRNPLYLFSAIGMMGLGFLIGSFMLGLLFFFFTYAAFLYVIKRESEALAHYFGDDYRRYCKTTPEFFPTFFPTSNMDTKSDSVVFSAKALKRTFLDASLFLLAIPLAEMLERLHETGAVQAYFHLY